MRSNQQYARNTRWLETQMKEADRRGKICSPVLIDGASPQAFDIWLLRVRQKELRLENMDGLYFRMPVEKIETPTWVRRGSLIQLNIEVAGNAYGLQIYALSSLKLTDSYGPKNWFSGLFPIFLFNTMRLFARGQEVVKANFTEAEKWRAVFPNAPFPDTKIPNAKS